MVFLAFSIFFFFNDTATTEIYTLSLHDALPISIGHQGVMAVNGRGVGVLGTGIDVCYPKENKKLYEKVDRKSTRLNSSHLVISYAVFCLKKKNITNITMLRINPM